MEIENPTGFAADIAQILITIVTFFLFIWGTEWFYFGRSVRSVRKKSDEISSIIADAFEKNTYKAMFDAAEQIFDVEAERLSNLYRVKKINKRISLDLEFFQINKQKEKFKTEFEKKGELISKLNEGLRAYGEEKDGVVKIVMVNNIIMTRQELEEELKKERDDFQQTVLSPSLQWISYQMGKIREKLFRKLKL